MDETDANVNGEPAGTGFVHAPTRAGTKVVHCSSPVTNVRHSSPPSTFIPPPTLIPAAEVDPCRQAPADPGRGVMEPAQAGSKPE